MQRDFSRLGQVMAVGLALLLGGAQAQAPATNPPATSQPAAAPVTANVVFVEQNAAELLARALNAQGLADPASLQTALFTQEAHFLDEEGPEATETDRIYYDIPGARAATFDNMGLSDEGLAVVTPSQALYAPKGGEVLVVPRRQVYMWHSPFDLGPSGLALARTPGTTVEARGQETWDIAPGLSFSGEVLRLRLHWHNVDYLLDAQGVVQAARSFDSDSDDEPMTFVPREWSTVGGVKWMTNGDVFMFDTRIATVKYRDIQLNTAPPVTFPLASFTLPGVSDFPAPLHSNVSAQPEQVTAQDLLDESIFAVARRYGGLSKVNASGWRRDLQPQLTAACAGQAECAPATATPVINALLDEVDDPHMSFTPAARVQKNQAGVALYYGFGVLSYMNRVIVREVMPGTPAARAGLHVGDLIENLNGKLVDASTYWKNLPDDQVTLTVTRQGEPVKVELKSTTTEPPEVQYTLRPDGVGLLRISGFEQDGTGQKVHDAVHKALTDKVKGLIVDLRWNSGGQLTQFLLSAGAFTQPSTLWLKQPYALRQFQYLDGAVKVDGMEVTRVNNPARYSGPLVVLVNGASASGAEFMARDLQGRPQTTLMGTQTVGVANTTVRRSALSDGSELRITVSVVQDAQGKLVTAAITPPARTILDITQLVGMGQDSMLEEAASQLK